MPFRSHFMGLEQLPPDDKSRKAPLSVSDSWFFLGKKKNESVAPALICHFLAIPSFWRSARIFSQFNQEVERHTTSLVKSSICLQDTKTTVGSNSQHPNGVCFILRRVFPHHSSVYTFCLIECLKQQPRSPFSQAVSLISTLILGCACCSCVYTIGSFRLYVSST